MSKQIPLQRIKWIDLTKGVVTILFSALTHIIHKPTFAP